MADLTDEQRLRNEVERADQAAAVLKNPLFDEAFKKVEAEILLALEQTHDDALTVKLATLFRCSRKYRNILSGVIETGKLAGIQLEEKQKRKLWSIS